jgi:CheY-like chemotaxis protein
MSLIYLIDDDYIYLNFTARMLMQVFPNARVRSFANAADALTSLEKERPDLIFLDINMPGMDGWEFLEAFPPSMEGKTEIYMVSSSIDPEDASKAAQHSKVSRFLEKPLGKKQLESVFADRIKAQSGS